MNNAVIPQDLLQSVAKITGTVDVNAFQGVLFNTVMPNNVNVEQATAFLMVAKEYKLNPITKEIYAFPSKGGIQPIVSVDGWLKIINQHPQFNGLETTENFDNDNNLISTTAKIYRKDRDKPVIVTEYLAECDMNTQPWKKYPVRMLRHKATIQAARYAFGFSGIVDEDEAQRIAPSSNDIVMEAEPVNFISTEQAVEINALIESTGSDISKFLAWLGANSVEQMNETQYAKAKVMLGKKAEKKQKQPTEPVQEAQFTEIQGEDIPL